VGKQRQGACKTEDFWDPQLDICPIKGLIANVCLILPILSPALTVCWALWQAHGLQDSPYNNLVVDRYHSHCTRESWGTERLSNCICPAHLSDFSIMVSCLHFRSNFSLCSVLSLLLTAFEVKVLVLLGSTHCFMALKSFHGANSIHSTVFSLQQPGLVSALRCILPNISFLSCDHGTCSWHWPSFLAWWFLV
jgi:hypothetical protein